MDLLNIKGASRSYKKRLILNFVGITGRGLQQAVNLFHPEALKTIRIHFLGRDH